MAKACASCLPDSSLLHSTTLDDAEIGAGIVDTIMERYVLVMDLRANHGPAAENARQSGGEWRVESNDECMEQCRGVRQAGFKAAQAHLSNAALDLYPKSL